MKLKDNALAVLAGIAMPLLTAVVLTSAVIEARTVKARNDFENTPTDGMCFDVKNVVEEYEVGDDMYCIEYTDYDLNMKDCQIFVDYNTYVSIYCAIKNESDYEGQLVYNHTSSNGKAVYTYAPSEF